MIGYQSASIYSLSESVVYNDPEEFKLSAMNTILAVTQMPVLIFLKYIDDGAPVVHVVFFFVC